MTTILFYLFYPAVGHHYHHHHNIIDQKDCTILVISGQFVGVRTVKLVVSSACSSYCAFSSTESYIHSVGEIFLSDYQEVMIAHGKLQDLSASHYVKLGLGNYVGWLVYIRYTFLFLDLKISEALIFRPIYVLFYQ